MQKCHGSERASEQFIRNNEGGIYKSLMMMLLYTGRIHCVTKSPFYKSYKHILFLFVVLKKRSSDRWTPYVLVKSK